MPQILIFISVECRYQFSVKTWEKSSILHSYYTFFLRLTLLQHEVVNCIAVIFPSHSFRSLSLFLLRIFGRLALVPVECLVQSMVSIQVCYGALIFFFFFLYAMEWGYCVNDFSSK